MISGLYRRLAASEDNIRRLLILCLSIGFASLIASAIAAAWFTKQSQDHAAAVVHTYEVEKAIAAFRVPMWRAEATRRGYIITPNPAILPVYREMSGKLIGSLEHLAMLTADNPGQRRRIDRLRMLSLWLMAQRDMSIDRVSKGKVSEKLRAEWIDQSIAPLLEIGRLNEAMFAEEQRLLAMRDARQAASLNVFYTILSIAGILVLIVAGLTAVTLRRYTEDLMTSRDRLRDLADGLEDSVRERTADLTRANEEIQRFAYIVSHDLRSPLVNVLGFTSELETATGVIGDFIDSVEQQAPNVPTDAVRAAVREDLPEAIGFIRTSTQKMDRLINAILKLSREGRRVITPEPIEMVPLVETIEATLRHRLDDAGAELRIDGPLPAIVSDRLAIEQIMSNLIENAVKYLQPGRPGRIAIRGALRGRQAVFAVEDNGRGIDPRDHQRIFDLFRRSGAQDQPGEGIGLAHVRALAYRLGGTITVESALGAGSIFTLAVPQKLNEPPGATP